MSQVPVGAKGELKLLVTSEVAVDFLGLEEARVLGTPFLIGWMEMAARNAIKAPLDEGFDTVGTMVHVRHLAATPIGMQVTFQAEVLEVDGRRVLCRVEAFDEKEKIGEGTHERAIIQVAKFAQRLISKRDQ